MTFLESPRFGESPAGCGSANRDCKQKFRLLRRYRIGCAGVLAGLLLSASGESLAQDPLPEIFLFTTVDGDPVSRFAENSGSTQLTVNVSRTTGGPEVVISFSMVGTGDNPATAGVDFVVEDFEVTIPAGNTLAQRSFNLAVTQDMLVERDETLRLMVSASGYTFNSSTTFRITDDDSAAVTFVSSEVTVSEGDGMATVTVVLTGEVEGGLAVRARTRLVFDGATNTRADNRSDYTETDTDLMFDASTTQVEYSVPILEDNLDEELERFEVLLELAASEPQTGRTITFPDNAVVTITDNDTAPTGITLMLTPASVFEGSSGSTTTSVVTVTAMLSGGTVGAALETATRLTISVESGGSNPATEGTDFTAVGDFRLTIPSGSSDVSDTFILELTGDTVVEEDETLTVSGRGSDLPITGTTLTITDDDANIVLSIPPATSPAEGAAPTTVAVTATLSGFLPADNTSVMVSVDGGTATEGTDFTAVDDFTITIPGSGDGGDGTGTGSFDLTVTDDMIVDPDETVTVSGTAADRFGTIPPLTLTIADNDTAPAPATITLSLDPPSLREPRGSQTASTTITVTAEFPEGSPTLLADTVVMVSVAGGAANPAATEGEDFATVTDFPVTIDDGETSGSGTFVLTGFGDRFAEGDETLTVSGSVGSLDVMPATLTITDNDRVPTGLTLTPSPVSVSEGDTGTTTTTITVTADIPRGDGRPFTDLVIPISVVGGGDNPATAGGTDFATVTGATVTIPRGGFTGTNTFDLVVTGDTLAEVDETLMVTGTAAVFGLTSAPVTLTITDESTDTDTGTPTIALSLDPLSAPEGDETTVMVTATLSGERPTGATTVMVMVAAGTATVGEDFTAVDPFPIMIPGVGGDPFATGSFVLTVVGDMMVDPEETVMVSGTAGSGFGTIDPQTLTITDNDIPPTVIELSVNSGDADDPTSVTEDSATTPIMVTAAFPTGSPTLATATDVQVTVAGGTATAGSSTDTGRDFTEVLTPFTVTIPAGETSSTTPGSFSLTVNDDDDDELDETVTVSGMALGTTTITAITPATLTITDNDAPPTVQRVDLTASVTEGDASAVATFTVHLNRRGHLATTVTMEDDRNWTATQGTDYTLDTGDWPFGTNEFVITVQPNELSATGTFRLSVAEDEIVEGNEEIRFPRIKVNGVAAGVVPQEFLKILDNDEATVSLGSPPVAENAGPVTVTATVDKMVEGGFTIPVSTMTGSADATDFTEVAEMTLTFVGDMEGETQTFTVPILDDSDPEVDEMFSVSLGAAIASRINLPAGDGNLPVINTGDSIMVTITDDDTSPDTDPPGVIITPTTLTVTEGETTETYTVTLSSAPAVSATVAITMDPGTTAPITVETTSPLPPLPLVFTSANWNMAQTLTVTATEDADAIGGLRTLSHTVTGSGYRTVTADPVEVTVTDDDIAEFIFEGGGIVDVTEGSGDATLTAVLDRAIPTGFQVTISIMGSADSAIFDAEEGRDFDLPAVSDMTLTFVGTANERQTLTVPILDDDIAEATEHLGFGVAMVVPPESELPFVNFGGSSSGQIQIIDDDTAGVSITPTTLTVTEGGAQKTYTVELDTEPAGTVVVSISADSGAAPPITFSPASLSFDSTTWSTAKTVTVTATEDPDTVGGTRTLTHMVSDYPGVVRAADVTVTVNDNDVAPTEITLFVTTPDTSASVTEDSGITTVMVTAAFPPGSPTLTTETVVQVTVAGGTATAGSSTDTGRDFTEVLAPFTVTIPPGETTSTTPGSFSLTVNDDGDDELDETVTVSGMALGTTTITAITPATLTITDNDAPPTVQRVDLTASVTEGDASAVATFTVHLNRRGHLATTVTMEDDRNWTATQGTDYTLDTGDWPFGTNEFAITVQPDELSGTGTFRLSVAEDEIVEGNEEIRFPRIKVNGVAAGVVPQEFLKILDNDEATVSLGSPPVAENAGPVTVTATVDKMVEGGFTIPVSTMTGSADATDFTAVTGMTLTFVGDMEGETQTFMVPILDDDDVEGDEVFSVSLGAAIASRSNLPAGETNLPMINAGDSVTVTITDSDTAPTAITLSLNPDQVAEDAVLPTVEVTAAYPGGVTLTADTVVTVTVEAGTALAADFTSTTTMITIPMGMDMASGTLSLTLVDDTLVEGNETLMVTGTATDFTIASRTLTITDSDTAPTAITLSLASPSVAEDAVSPTVEVTAAFPPGSATLTEDTVVTVTVEAGTALAADFTSTTTMITIPMGMDSASGTLPLTLVDDTLVEGNETLMVTGTATRFTIAPQTLTITDNDTAPTTIALSLDPSSVAEDAVLPTVGVTAAFPPGSGTLTADTVVTVTVEAGTALAADFTSTTTMITIPMGMDSASGTLSLTLVDDTLVEGNETLMVTGTATDFTIASRTLTITDSDTAPTAITLSLNPDQVAEDAVLPTVEVTAAYPGGVTLTADTVVTVTVEAGTALAADFTSTTTMITIPMGMDMASSTLSLTLVDDTLVEGNETLMVTGTATDFTIDSRTLTITDDDTAPTEIMLSLASPSVAEDAVSPTVEVTAAFPPGSATLTEDTVVTVTVEAGTALAADFTSTTTMITIPMGMDSASGTLPLTLVDDTLVEGNETLMVTGTATRFTIAPQTLTITDNDTAPTTITLSLDPSSVAEDAVLPTVEVTAAFPPGSGTLTADTVVTVTVEAGTALAADFTSTTTMITIPMGMDSASGTLSLTLVDDTLVEGNETLMVTGTATRFTIAPQTLTITDNDTAPTTIALSLDPSSVAEDAVLPTVEVTAAFPPGSGTLTADTVVTVTVEAGTALAADFTSTTTMITIPMGMDSASGTLSLTLVDDTLVEGNETLMVTGTATDFTIASRTLTITDSDTAPTAITLSLNPDQVAEDAVLPTVEVTAAYPGGVTLTADTVVTVTVEAGTALAADFTSTTTMITIPMGMDMASSTLSLTLVDDTLVEGNETLMVTGTATDFTIDSRTLTITDDDTAPTEIMLSLASPSVAEDAVSPTVEVTAAFPPGSATLTEDTVVTVTVEAGTALAADFTSTTTMITIPMGMDSASGTLPLTLVDDTLVEGNETLMVTGTATRFTIAPQTLTITDNDTAPTTIALSLDPSSVAEDAVLPTVEVTAAFPPGSGTLTADTVVTVTVEAGTALAADFTSTTTMITIPMGMDSASGTLPLTLVDDTLVEGNETLMVTGTATDFTIDSRTLTITDSDTAPTAITLSLNPDQVAEDAVLPTVEVTAAYPGGVTLTADTVVTVTVEAGTALAADFTSTTTMITIPMGMDSMSGTLSLTLVDDTLVEGNETLMVTGTATDFTIAPQTLTIIDDETPPTTIALSLDPSSVAEDAVLPTVEVTAAFPPGSATLTADTVVTVTVEAGTALAADFTSTTTMITIPMGMGMASSTLSLTLVDDTLVEGNETLMVTGTATDFTIDSRTLTITDDDTAPTEIMLSLASPSVAEDAVSPTVEVTAAFPPGSATLTEDTVVTVTVEAGTALAADFTSTTTMITIPMGMDSASGTLPLTLVDDTLVEGNETLMVTGTATRFTIAPQTLTITDNDTAPTTIALSLDPSSVAEDAVLPTVGVTAAFPPGSGTLTADTVVTVTVEAGTALAADFTSTTTMITIPMGMDSASGTLSLTLVDDTLVEGDETLMVTGTATDFTIAPQTLTITDDDTAPTEITLSLNPDQVAEDAVSPTVEVTAAFPPGSGTLTADTVVTVTVEAGTALAADFTSTTTMITIPMGMDSMSGTLSLTLVDDTLVEGNETLMVTGTATDFTIAPQTLTIIDDETPPTTIALSLDPSSVAEDAVLPTVEVTAAFPPGSATLTADTVVTVTVEAGTALAADFTSTTTMITIPMGMDMASSTLSLTLVDDTLVEGNETLMVTGTATDFTIDSRTLTITDDDTAPTEIMLSLASPSVAEDAVSPTVEVTAAFPPGSATLTEDTVVTVTVEAGTALAADFTSTTTMITIPMGMDSASGTLPLTLVDDTLVEGNETLMVTGTATRFTIAPQTLTITDNDTAPTTIALSLNPSSVAEDAVLPTVEVTAAFPPGSGTLTADTVVTVTVEAGTALAADFTSTTTMITIPMGMDSASGTLSLTLVDDTLVEGNETLMVTGSADLSVTSTTLTITDSDTAPTEITLSLNPTSVAEDAAPTVVVTAAYPGGVTLTAPAVVMVTVEAGTALAADFTSTPIMITIPMGMNSMSGTLSLTLIDDTLVEGDETLMVTGSADLSVTSATLTITDSDTAPTTIALSLSPTSVAEDATMTITVTAEYPGNVTLTTDTVVTVAVGDVGDSTTEGTDYATVADITITIAANMNSNTGTFQFTPTDDTVFTSNKTVTVSGTATSYTVTSATLTIDDDETPPASVTLAVATVGESAGAVTVTATLDNEVVGGLTITVATADGTATAGEDYTTPTVILMFAGTPGEIQTFPVTILGDIVVEGDETFTISLTAPATFPDTIDITSTATVTISDDEVNPTTVILTLAPDRVQEDSGTTTIAVSVAYPGGVTLTTATEVTVSVAGGTADGEATVGTDFTAVPAFTLTIAMGESSSAGSFILMVTEDEESEGNETLTVSAAAAGFTVTSAPLTILEVDSTEIVMEVVPELARLSVTSVIDAVADRVGRAVAGTASTLVSFAGHQSLAPALAANEQKLNDGDLSWREILKNSSFDLNLEGTDEEAGSGGGQADPGGAVGIWVSGGYESVSSESEFGAWGGDLFSVHAGVDMRVSENVLVGVAANRSKGSFEFDEPRNNTDSQLTAISPYLGWNSGDGAGLWATIGYGKGHVEVVSDNGVKRDITMAMAAVGGSMDVSVDDEVSLTVKGEALTAQLETKAAVGTQEAVTANIQRLRLAVEVQDVTVQEAGEQFTRSAALGIRYDGGDGDTGLGAELDGELGWSVPATGVTLRANGHVLLAHQSDLKEWGVGGLIRYDIPGSSEGRGLSLRLQPSYGAESDSGQLWEHQVTELESESDDAPGARLAMGLDWGLSALSGRGLLTPYGNLELSEDGARVYRLGSRFEIGPAIHIDLGGDRKETADEAPEHGIDLAVRVSW